MSFNKYRNLLKECQMQLKRPQRRTNSWPSLALKLINTIRGEHPEWFDEELQLEVERACRRRL